MDYIYIYNNNLLDIKTIEITRVICRKERYVNVKTNCA